MEVTNTTTLWVPLNWPLNHSIQDYSVASYHEFLIPFVKQGGLVILALVLFGFGGVKYLIDSHHGNASVKAPYIGSTSLFYTRWQFFRNAYALVDEGYAKFKNQPFKLSGDDILVIPSKYVDEMRNMPDSKLSSIQANIDNFEGLYSITNILLEGTLHTRMIQTKLTPRLGMFVPIVREQLDIALEKELPKCDDDFVSVKGFFTICHIVSRLSARVFVGDRLCQDEEWLKTSLTYTENAFATIIALRCLPNWAKGPTSWLMPSAYRVSTALRATKRIIGGEVRRRRVEQAKPDWNEADKPFDFIQFMMENANEYDGQPHKLAHRQLILSLASIHTTSMACTQTLFDLIARPEYLVPLREEVEQVLREDGGWKKTSLTKMRKLDSFMRESQRLNPPSLLGFKRAPREDITLSDGTRLPKDAHTMVAIYPIQMEETKHEHAAEFDGFRHYRKRQEPGEAYKHQFATTSNDNLHFGHGKYSCPGRFFAANTIKIIIGTFLMQYDVKLPPGKSRPENWPMHEYVFPNPEAEVLIRKRKSTV